MSSSSAPERAPGRPRPVSLPLPLLFALSLVVAMGLLAGALLWQGWTAGRDIFLSATRDRAESMGQVIAARVEATVAPASQAVGYLAAGLLPGIQSQGENHTPERLDGFRAVFDSLSFLSAIIIAWDDGAFFSMQRMRPERPARFGVPDRAVYVVRQISGSGPDRPLTRSYYDANLTLLEVRAGSTTTYDARERSWFRDTPPPPGEHVSEPYIFYASHQLGMTLSERMATDDGVIGLDVTVVDLGVELAEVRPTPDAEMAVLSINGETIASTADTDLGPDERPTLSPVIRALLKENLPAGESVSFVAEGRTWFGITLPLKSPMGGANQLVMAVPEDEILATLRLVVTDQLWLAAGITVLLLAIGWVTGHRLGRGLTLLAEQANRMTRFDFSRPTAVRSYIREIDDFHAVLDTVSGTIRDFLTTSDTIASEERLERMLGEVLARTVKGTLCRRGTVYLADEARPVLVREADVTAPGEMADDDLPAELPLSAVQEGAGVVPAAGPGLTRLVLPLVSRIGHPLGLLVLTHHDDSRYGNEAFGVFVRKLSGLLAVSIETRRLIESQRRLLDGFIDLIADAIDAKSPYTGAHCRRVPKLAIGIVDRLEAEASGPYAEFRLDPTEREAFRLGAWLHDCGKVTSPEHIIDKATKLEAVHNRIHEIRTRFEVLHRDATIAHLERLLAGASAPESSALRNADIDRLTEEFAFVARSNIGGEFMTDADLARLRAIAGRSWVRHFDDRLGLSSAEEGQLAGVPAPVLPVAEPLLADRPSHITPWDAAHRPAVEKGDPANLYGFDMRLPAHRQNLGELYNLSIRRGTLNDEERFVVNDHVVQTYIMLTRLPWPDGFGEVPEIAATHHERMDGKGYPRRIGADRLTIPQRVMAIADVFEALTASDRPYKRAKTLSEAFEIMVRMGTEGHLDPELMAFFLRSRVWRTYAARALAADQDDAVDVDGLVARLVPAAG